MLVYDLIAVEVGTICYAFREERLVHLSLWADMPDPKQIKSLGDDAVRRKQAHPQLDRDLRRYFSGQPTVFEVPVNLEKLPPFRRKVLEQCAGIAYGQRLTYGQLATRLGRPGAARAVGQALAANPIPIVIPCHRVVAANGRLGGFSAQQGVRLKKWLLDMEAGNGPACPT